jgi:hypothetical protein
MKGKGRVEKNKKSKIKQHILNRSVVKEFIWWRVLICQHSWILRVQGISSIVGHRMDRATAIRANADGRR